MRIVDKYWAEQTDVAIGRQFLALATALSSYLGYIIFRARQTVTRCHRSGGECQLGDLIPYLESGGKFGAVGGGGHPVAGWAEVWGDTAECGEKPLR